MDSLPCHCEAYPARSEGASRSNLVRGMRLPRPDKSGLAMTNGQPSPINQAITEMPKIEWKIRIKQSFLKNFKIEER